MGVSLVGDNELVGARFTLGLAEKRVAVRTRMACRLLRAACAAYLYVPIRRFEAGLSGLGVPRLGTGVQMLRRCHAEVEDRFHELHRIFFTHDDGKRTNFSGTASMR